MATNARLRQDLVAELTWEPSGNATRVGVEVSDRIAKLAGPVDSHGEKWHAELPAQRVGGVNALAGELARSGANGC